MYGEYMGTATLCEALHRAAGRIRNAEDNGVLYSDMIMDDVKALMQGSMVLYDRMLEELREERP